VKFLKEIFTLFLTGILFITLMDHVPMTTHDGCQSLWLPGSLLSLRLSRTRREGGNYRREFPPCDGCCPEHYIVL